MEILVIGDLHCRSFWKTAVDKWDGPIVFLGDYIDPYPFDFTDKQIPNNIDSLLSVLEFADKNQDRVSLLIGNHDWSYLYNRDASRHDFLHHDEIKEIYLDYLELLSIAKQYDNILFTHSGVSKSWLLRHDLILPKENADIYLNKIWDKNSSIFWEIGWSRGGWDKTGSPLWRDIREQDLDNTLYQVYGHTYIQKPYITSQEACLDVGKQAFIIDTQNNNITSFNYE